MIGKELEEKLDCFLRLVWPKTPEVPLLAGIPVSLPTPPSKYCLADCSVQSIRTFIVNFNDSLSIADTDCIGRATPGVVNIETLACSHGQSDIYLLDQGGFPHVNALSVATTVNC